MEYIASEGVCVFCNKTYKKTGISRHFKKHLDAIPRQGKASSYHVKVECGPYFLQLLIDGNAYMDELDHFLRRIWLECCGHLSAFLDGRDEISMSTKARNVLYKGGTLEHHYDFGTTTLSNITTINEYDFATPESIKLLSRNNPLELYCNMCKKQAATSICVIHWGEDNHFCDSCTEKHQEVCEDAADYSLLPVVNSPRYGECGYDGGAIDKERDGVFKL